MITDNGWQEERAAMADDEGKTIRGPGRRWSTTAGAGK